MQPNFLAALVAALSTFVVGFIWYNPKVFGTIWMRESGLSEEKMKGANMFKIFGLTFVFAFLIAFSLMPIVIHQFGAMSMVGGYQMAESAKPSYNAFMADYGHAYRTFKHGMLHGALTGIFLILPVIGTNALFERKSWKYVLINSGYWTVCFTIIGGIVCAWE